MIKWDDAIKTALSVYLHRDRYAYFYGAKGEVLTDEQMQYLWNCYPSYFNKYTEQQKKEIFNYSRGKMGLDCSGFISKITGLYLDSRSFWGLCTDRQADIYAGPAGSLVYTTFNGRGSHIGLDIGYGYVLSFDAEYGTCNLSRILENTIDWEGTGLLKGYIDYTGANNR